ncbi:MAG: MaoC/PaaZ C-terminal domain-containing protein [Myxococcota bacterium]|jgi:acyl dehydratase|nr:MaoC/PaaZ C-terminal domain-containing protein [Myxococcota bacterium]
MTLKLEAVGQPLPESRLSYTWKDVVLYALAVGARETDLDLLLELRPLKVLPTYAVIPTFEPLRVALAAARVDFLKVLHGEMRITLRAPIPSHGTLVTKSVISGIYDVGKHAILHLDTVSSEDGQDIPLFETRWTIVVRGEGGFGGTRPPSAGLVEPPADRLPDFRREVATLPTQALLYRLTGDVNPLHADPGVAKVMGYDRPILHGLCTYGHVGLVVARELCGGDVRRLQGFFARFLKEVYPGDSLTVEGWRLADGQVAVRALVGETVVLGNGLVTLNQD